jgi:hypothetical protein
VHCATPGSRPHSATRDFRGRCVFALGRRRPGRNCSGGAMTSDSCAHTIGPPDALPLIISIRGKNREAGERSQRGPPAKRMIATSVGCRRSDGLSGCLGGTSAGYAQSTPRARSTARGGTRRCGVCGGAGNGTCPNR